MLRYQFLRYIAIVEGGHCNTIHKSSATHVRACDAAPGNNLGCRSLKKIIKGDWAYDAVFQFTVRTASVQNNTTCSSHVQLTTSAAGGADGEGDDVAPDLGLNVAQMIIERL